MFEAVEMGVEIVVLLLVNAVLGDKGSSLDFTDFRHCVESEEPVDNGALVDVGDAVASGEEAKLPALLGEVERECCLACRIAEVDSGGTISVLADVCFGLNFSGHEETEEAAILGECEAFVVDDCPEENPPLPVTRS